RRALILSSRVPHPLRRRILLFFLLLRPPPPSSTLFPYTTLFRSPLSDPQILRADRREHGRRRAAGDGQARGPLDRRRHQLHRLRSEEHTSELQSRFDLVCRLLLEKKNNNTSRTVVYHFTCGTVDE